MHLAQDGKRLVLVDATQLARATFSKFDGGAKPHAFQIKVPLLKSEKRTRKQKETPRTSLSGRRSQQFTYGVVSEGVVAESLRKFCGNFAEICKKYVSSGRRRNEWSVLGARARLVKEQASYAWVSIVLALRGA